MKDDLNARPALHSSEYLGADRDFLWNADYVGLLGSRLGLRQCKWVLDVGCGRGHWTLALLPWLAKFPRLVGVDREPEHLGEYERIVNLQRGVAGAKGLCGDAEHLPVTAETFDLVTCQTLLMHVQRPIDVVSEMVRAVRPGGLVMCVEPNNTISRMPFSEISMGLDPEKAMLLSELALRTSIGLKLRGKSDELLGEQLPGLMQDAGLLDVKVWTSDKVFLDLPPYDSREQELRHAAADDHWENGSGPFSEEEARESFLAAEGSAVQFGRCWTEYEAAWQSATAQRKLGRWRAAGGGLLYIATGRKPEQALTD